jgi:hypothetical protein
MYCAVGIPDDASTNVGISNFFAIPDAAGPLSAVDVCGVPKVSSAVVNVLIVSS